MLHRVVSHKVDVGEVELVGADQGIFEGALGVDANLDLEVLEVIYRLAALLDEDMVAQFGLGGVRLVGIVLRVLLRLVTLDDGHHCLVGAIGDAQVLHLLQQHVDCIVARRQLRDFFHFTTFLVVLFVRHLIIMNIFNPEMLKIKQSPTGVSSQKS